MEQDRLAQLWHRKYSNANLLSPEDIIKKATGQRNRQFIAIAVMSITVLLLIIYASYYLSDSWNNFALGLILMISSLSFRIFIELVSLNKKESRLIALDNLSFRNYLRRYYNMRLKVNYMITPICFALYVFGFTLLLPYFKLLFSESLYRYIFVSGFISLSVLAVIIINGVMKEIRFLRLLKKR